jgi:hypothetical protein
MGLTASSVPRSEIDWHPCYRAIPSRFPPIGLFERVADPADLEDVFAIESLTNARLRDEAGEISLVPREERVSGPGTGHVMAAFTHVRPEGGRFHDGSFGAFYAGAERATAIAETVYHRERFLRDQQAPPTEVDMRMLRARVRGEMHDLRGMQERAGAIYDPADYTAGQRFSRAARAEGAWGIVYDSVRKAGGTCVAVLRPRAISGCKQAEHLGYVWNGESIGMVYEKRIVRR